MNVTDDYSPFDQDEKLPSPPWKPTHPALVAWEAAHGHDVRLKCYPEFGCRVIEAALERENETLRAERDAAQAEVEALKVRLKHAWGHFSDAKCACTTGSAT